MSIRIAEHEMLTIFNDKNKKTAYFEHLRHRKKENERKEKD